MPDGSLIAIRMRLTGGKQVAAESEAAAKGIAKTGVAADAASAKQQKAAVRAAKMATSLRSVGRGLTTYVSLPIAGVGVAAGVMALDFDRSMRNVNSIAQLPQRRFAALKQQVLDLAGPTAQAPKTLADGLYDLVSSGFKADDAVKVLRASAFAASAGLTTTDVATRAVAASLNAYHLDASKAGWVSDNLFETVNRGVLSFEDLANSIGDALPFANELGVTLPQVGAAISTMTKQGLSSSESTTRLKNVLVTLIKPGKDLGNTLEDMNTTGAKLVEKRGLQGALEAILGTTDGTQEAVGKLFPNIRALGGVLALTGKSAGFANEDLAAFKDTAGATQTVLHEQEKSFGFKLQRGWAELQASLVRMGEDLLPVVVPFIIELAHGAESAVSAFADLPGPMQKTLMVTAGLVALAGPMLLFASAVLTAAKNLGILTLAESGGGLALNKAKLGRLGAGVAGGALLAAGQTGVGGKTGELVGNIGGGAALGFSVGGPFGAAVGGTAGAVVTALPEWEALFTTQKKLGPLQARLAASSGELTSHLKQQRVAAHGLVGANQRLSRAQDRERDASRSVSRVRARLNAVIGAYGPHSRQAILAEARLTDKIGGHIRALRRLHNAEKLHGVAQRAYKVQTTSTILAERHRINVLTSLRDRQARLFTEANKMGPQSARTRELAQRLLSTEGKLSTAQKKHGETLTDAATKVGPKYARFLQNANQETLRAGGAMKLLNERAAGLTRTMERLSETEVTLPSLPEPGASLRPRRHGANAAGTGWWRGGLSLVGERGPELVDVPRGARVLSAPRTRDFLSYGPAAKAAAQGASGGTRYLVPINLRVDRRVLAEAVEETKDDAEARL